MKTKDTAFQLDYESYRVYTLKTEDYISFGENDLEKLKGEQNELHTI